MKLYSSDIFLEVSQEFDSMEKMAVIKSQETIPALILSY